MITATFVKEITRMCPVTNLYSCSDGKYILVTVKRAETMPIPPAETLDGIPIIIDTSQNAIGTEAFLSDNRGRILDNDGNPDNGMTPIEVFNENLTHAQALAQLGYELSE